MKKVNFKSISVPLLSYSYEAIEKSVTLSGLIRKGGIRFKLSLLISMTLLFIVIAFILLFTVMATNSLMSANDKLCMTIAGNISSAESVLTGEPSPFKRSLILQDMVNGLAKSGIDGLEYTAVYDLSGKLVERKASYAAHTDSLKRAQKIPDVLFNEIKDVESFQKTKFISMNANEIPVNYYQYRMPLKFFDVKVGVIEIVFSEDSILEPIRKAGLKIIFFSCIILLLGFTVAVVAATGIVHPIKGISEGMIKVREGDLEIKLDIKRHDEIGDLSREFNTMIVHLREKLQMQKFVSERTTKMIHENTAAGEIVIGGSRKNYAFLFSDVRGFTTISEKLEPEEVVKILNEYLDLQAKIIKKNNGDIDKFVGDEIMAVFRGKDMADNAIMSAIEIAEKIQKINNKKTNDGEKIVNIGIGLHLGEVVEGRIGSSERMDNTSIGDTVNIAARLCSYAEPGIILASKYIVSKAKKGKFVGKELEPISVKGKDQPIEIFSITGFK